MAKEDNKAYPMMPEKHWWALRRRFRKTLPSSVDASYLHSTLGMSERAASNNILPALKKTGILDDDGKTTDRAKKWRDDRQYPEVCKAILEELYPQSLREVASDTSANREEVERWFATTTGAGTSAVGKMTAFYMRLLQADPSKDTGEEGGTASAKPKDGKGKQKRTAKDKPRGAEKPPVDYHVGTGGHPAIHFDIQVHISPDTTLEQIDKVFESMAKHLKGLL